MEGLLLHLYGPMQSWADTGFGQLREAGEFPSRSAVIGLVAAAMGIPRANERLVDIHDSLKTHVASVRTGSILRDFHTVETRVGFSRTLTLRDYHHDAHFVVLVTGDSSTVEEAFRGLSEPHYGMFLGRRSCPPALPLIPKVVSGEPFQALVDATLGTADEFPNGDGTWRRKVWPTAVQVWLDGHYEMEDLPGAFRNALHITHGNRRTRLKGPRRAYAGCVFTHIVLRPFLFSLDKHAAYYSLLVQSDQASDWSFLTDEVACESKIVDPGRVPTETPLRFFLRANPTVARRGYRDGKTRRVAVGTNPKLVFRQMGQPELTPTSSEDVARWRDEELKTWLRRQGERNGFRVELDTVQSGPIVEKRLVRTENGQPKGKPMIFHEVEFTGVLRITDVDEFRVGWSKGLGRGKAFGYGLLMIRPA